MSERTEYFKRLMKKALIIYDSLGPNESEDAKEYIDSMDVKHDHRPFYTDDAVPCKCGERSDVVAFSDKNYCCDCLHFIEKEKNVER